MSVRLTETVPMHQIGAATHVALGIGTGETSLERLRAGYRHILTCGRFSIDDLLRGERLLAELRLVSIGELTIQPSLALRPLLEEESRQATAISELIIECYLNQQARQTSGAPETADLQEQAHLLAALIEDTHQRQAFLLRMARKYDDSARVQLGLAAEQFIVSALQSRFAEAGRDDLAAKVEHVSLISDQVGYDIYSPTISGGSCYVEAKATTLAPSDGCYRVHLSRTEWDIGCRAQEWRLVICLADGDTFNVAGHCPATDLAAHVPVDPATGRWTQAEVNVPLAALTPGLPDVFN